MCGRTRSNAYLFSPADGRAMIVDPGVGAAPVLRAALERTGTTPEAILLTHGHFDHVWSARSLSDTYAIPVHIHAADRRWLDDPACGGYLPIITHAGRLAGRIRRVTPRRIEVIEGDTLALAGAEVRVVHTPGHTPGGVCFVSDGLCFTGDTLFAGGPGHTGYPGGSRVTLADSVARLLDELDDETRLLPGHGPETTVGRVRQRLAAVATPRR